MHSLAPDSEGYLHVPFTQTALAEFLGVNRSALSRELGRMQDENLIEVNDKKIETFTMKKGDAPIPFAKYAVMRFHNNFIPMPLPALISVFQLICVMP